MGLVQAKSVVAEANGILFNTDDTLNDQGMARLQLKEEWLPDVNFCYIEASDELLIFAECGQIPEEHEAALLKELMLEQFLFDKCRGILFSLAPDTESLTVQCLLPVAVLDASRLIDIMVDFIQEVSKVRLQIIDSPDEDYISEPQEFVATQALV